MMDGLDPLLPKSNGHDYLVATLFAKHKTCLHLIQAFECPLPLFLLQAKVLTPLEMIVEHEVQVSVSKFKFSKHCCNAIVICYSRALSLFNNSLHYCSMTICITFLGGFQTLIML